MDVGINHPWVSYGCDFGPGIWETGPDYVPAWNRKEDVPNGKPQRRLDRQLQEYGECGIKAVRWFILADGWNYGTPTLKDRRWTFKPPSLSKLHLSHFEDLLKAFRESNTRLKLVPCFIDFNFLGPAKVVIPTLNPLQHSDEVVVPPDAESVDAFLKAYYDGPAGSDGFRGTATARRYRDDKRPVDLSQFIKGGRAGALGKANLTGFLDKALEPLLDVAKRYKDVILAWDIINEPEMVLQYLKVKNPPADRTVPLDQMTTFLIEAAKRVCKAGVPPTIGFQTARPLGLDDGSADSDPAGRLETLAKLAENLARTYKTSAPPFIGQFHYYPERCDQKRLPDPTTMQWPRACAVGEFSTQIGCPWPETMARDGIQQRLEAIKTKKYDYAFLWSAQNGLAFSSWKEKEWAAVKSFRR
jgi:hypothetical protein